MKTVTNIGIGLTTAQSNTNWTLQAQQTTILNQCSVNARFLRNIVLSTNGVRVIRNNLSVAINVADLVEAAVTVEPTLTSAPNVTTQPHDKFAFHGNAVALNIAAVGEFEAVVPITYQWQISQDNGSTWNTCNNAVSNAFANFTTNHLSVSNVDGLTVYRYRCLAISNAGNTNSNMANIAAVGPVSNRSVAAPGTTNFTIAIAGFGTFAYEWQLSTDGGGSYSNLSDNTIYSGSNTNIVAISNSTGLNGYKYRCLTNNGSAQIISETGTLTVT